MRFKSLLAAALLLASTVGTWAQPVVVTINNFPSATALTGAEFIPLWQGSGTKKVTLATLLAALPLTNGDLFVGNSSGIATGVAMSGDATLSNTGAVTVGSIGGKAVTLSAAFTTSGTSTPTLAFPSSGTPTYTLPTTSKTLMASDYSNGTTLTANALLTGGGAGAPPNAVVITGLVVGNGASAPTAYAGTSSAGNVLTALSAAGAGSYQPFATSGNNVLLETGSSGLILGAVMPALSGDASSSAGATVLTLATVNSNIGACGSSSAIPIITLNAKGLATACTTAALTSAPILYGYRSGLTLSTAGSSSSITMAVGSAVDSTNAQLMTLASALTKTTGTWAVGANGCLDTGSISASAWYAFFEIERTDLSAVDYICTLETAGTTPSPSMPTGYTFKRYIFSWETDSGAHWYSGTQVGRTLLYAASRADISGTPPNSATLETLAGAPLGLKTTWIGNVDYASSSNNYMAVWSPDNGSGIPAAHSLYAPVAGANNGAGQFLLRTDTSGRLYFYSSAGGAGYNVSTMGYADDN